MQADHKQAVTRIHRVDGGIGAKPGAYVRRPPPRGRDLPTRELFDVGAGILAIEVEWVDGLGDSFEKNHRALVGDQRVDCGFAAAGASSDVFDGARYPLGGGRDTLALFALRLLSKLQSLATVPAVDWQASAVQFELGEAT